MRITINAPSYRRPQGVTTTGLIPDVRLWICEADEEEYRKHNPKADLVVVPDSVQGNVCRIRNRILDQSYEEGVDAVCIVDDDMTSLAYFQRRLRRKLRTAQIMPWLERYSILAEEWGARMWGVNVNQDKQCYREYTPFSTLSFIGSPFTVHVHSPLRYDESLPLKEDYDMTLQHLNEYRIALRLNKFHYVVKQGLSGSGQTGGCATYRNLEREEAQFRLLQAKWGKKLVREDKNDRSHSTTKRKGAQDFNPVLRVPIQGV